YEDGQAWGAYGQFCRHFLAPLLLMVYKDIRLNKILSLFIDGVPLDLAARLLGHKGGFFALQHIVWHSKSIAKHEIDGRKKSSGFQIKISREKHLALIEALIRGIEKLKLKNVVTEWGDYYKNTNYTSQATEAKSKLVREFLKFLQPSSVWDLGANDGTYSRIVLENNNANVVAFDIDPIAVERNYQSVKKSHEKMLPLILDLTNPSPAIGFANQERKNINDRQKPDCVMALAVIHHLAISNNLPLEMLASWFADLSRGLIIEFVPKEDSQVELLLATRRDIFPNYNQENFERTFSEYFTLKKKENIQGSTRVLYCFERKEN
ncbi:MAG: class I SAM-dependent methyltransferase, partial [Synergistaceae bacterium]|nr:class I SAM-dependent methyltransferase [Synergistaceae bacterium]